MPTLGQVLSQSDSSFVWNIFKASKVNYWTGATSTAWATASNWSRNEVPDANTVVVIGSQANTPTIAADVSVCGVVFTSTSGTQKGINGAFNVNIGPFGLMSKTNSTNSSTSTSTFVFDSNSGPIIAYRQASSFLGFTLNLLSGTVKTAGMTSYPLALSSISGTLEVLGGWARVRSISGNVTLKSGSRLTGTDQFLATNLGGLLNVSSTNVFVGNFNVSGPLTGSQLVTDSQSVSGFNCSFVFTGDCSGFTGIIGTGWTNNSTSRNIDFSAVPVAQLPNFTQISGYSGSDSRVVFPPNEVYNFSFPVSNTLQGNGSLFILTNCSVASPGSNSTAIQVDGGTNPTINLGASWHFSTSWFGNVGGNVTTTSNVNVGNGNMLFGGNWLNNPNAGTLTIGTLTFDGSGSLLGVFSTGTGVGKVAASSITASGGFGTVLVDALGVGTYDVIQVTSGTPTVIPSVLHNTTGRSISFAWGGGSNRTLQMTTSGTADRVILWRPPGADTTTWTWATGSNWFEGSAPTSSDIASFTSGSFTSGTNAGTASIKGILVAGSTTISGTALTIGASGITRTGGDLTFSTPVVIGAAQTWTGTFTMTGAISGSATNITLASGTLTMASQTNTWTGTLTVPTGATLVGGSANNTNSLTAVSLDGGTVGGTLGPVVATSTGGNVQGSNGTLTSLDTGSGSGVTVTAPGPGLPQTRTITTLAGSANLTVQDGAGGFGGNFVTSSGFTGSVIFNGSGSGSTNLNHNGTGSTWAGLTIGSGVVGGGVFHRPGVELSSSTWKTFVPPVTINGNLTPEGSGPGITYTGVISGSGGILPRVLVQVDNASNTFSGTVTPFSGSGTGGIGGPTGLPGAHSIPSGRRIWGGYYTGTGTVGGTYTCGALTLSSGSILRVHSNATGVSKVVSTGALTSTAFTVEAIGSLNAGTYDILQVGSGTPTVIPTVGTNTTGRSLSFAWVSQTLRMTAT